MDFMLIGVRDELVEQKIGPHQFDDVVTLINAPWGWRSDGDRFVE
jgi:hypothetical protein